MTKINFTKAHYDCMCEHLLEMLLKNETIVHKMATLDVVALVHTTSINTLNSIRLELGKSINVLENQDEWTSSEVTQQKLSNLKDKKEMINLLIGYKRFNMEQDEIAARKRELTNQLETLKESQKTPEDKIKELEAELAGLKVETF